MSSCSDADRAVYESEADVAILWLVEPVRNARRERLLEGQR